MSVDLTVRRAPRAPTCARCGRAVDQFIESYDPFMQRLEFVAVCHGERERVTLSDRELREMQIGELRFGLAFVTPLGLPERIE